MALYVKDVGDTRVGYIDRLVEGVETCQLMLDSGSAIDCISLTFVRRLNLHIRTLAEPWAVLLANDRQFRGT